MKNKILSLMFLAVFVCLVPLTVSADSRRYTPPAEKGYIYIVIRYKGSFARKMKTSVSVNWGGWSHSEDVSPPTFAMPNNIPEGFVIRLTHRKNDSVAVDVNTDGNIVSVYQGEPPSEWNNGAYKKLQW